MRATLTERQELLRQTAREFALKELEPSAADVDGSEEFPRRQFEGLAAIGLLGLTMPEADGGAGGGYGELAVVIEELAAACGSTSTVFITHISLGTATIARFGNAEQRARWVPALSRGDKIAAFALSEPGSGSDALALATNAAIDGDDYTLNGSKVFITNGEVADVFVVFVNSDRSKGHRGISAVVVERDSPGFAVSHMTGKMGMRGSATAELSFQDCRVPMANRLGEEGRGYSVALSILSSSRVSIAAQCVGLARGAYDAAIK
jgi:alkylation response protein AidB-like acyl-CoA dehydrogenase